MTPLPELLRPQTIQDVVGQRHLLDQGKPLALAFASNKIHSMILWGPPGVGKTTIARLTADAFACHFMAISAVLAGVKEIRQAIEEAQLQRDLHQRTSILFVDEIHRFNKSQQDALLPHVESGLVTFIGATTENPSFEVNSALLSRAQVYVLKPLEHQDLNRLLQRALEYYASQQQALAVDEAAQNILFDLADGDARRFLNLIEMVFHYAISNTSTTVTKESLEHTLPSQLRRFDKSADQFYDQISALHKSVRGSDPDAALYWFCRMMDGGADAKYLARRIVRMAWEDIGLADPRAIQLANDAAQTYERLGSPEGELALAQTLIYLACAAKSNAGYNAYNQARAFVAQDTSQPVPMHLRNAPTQLMKNMGYGSGYRYAHDEQHGYAAGEHYLPDGMIEPHWYQPKDQGLEAKIKEKLEFLKSLDKKSK